VIAKNRRLAKIDGWSTVDFGEKPVWGKSVLEKLILNNSHGLSFRQKRWGRSFKAFVFAFCHFPLMPNHEAACVLPV